MISQTQITMQEMTLSMIHKYQNLITAIKTMLTFSWEVILLITGDKGTQAVCKKVYHKSVSQELMKQ